MFWRAKENKKNAPNPEEIRNKIKQQKENNKHITAEEIAKDKQRQANKNKSLEKWKKLGFSDEQSKELEELSHFTDNMSDVNIDTIFDILENAFEKINKEIHRTEAREQLKNFKEERKKNPDKKIIYPNGEFTI